jgi:hypothetical protein
MWGLVRRGRVALALASVILVSGCVGATPPGGPGASPPPQLDVTADGSAPGGSSGHPYSLQLTAPTASASPNWTIVGGALPQGLTMTPDGLISGTPTVAGLWSIDVVFDDGQGAARAALSAPWTVWGWVSQPAPPAPFPFTLTGQAPRDGRLVFTRFQVVAGQIQLDHWIEDRTGAVSQPEEVPIPGRDPIPDVELGPGQAGRLGPPDCGHPVVLDLTHGPVDPLPQIPLISPFPLDDNNQMCLAVLSPDARRVAIVDSKATALDIAFFDTADGTLLRWVERPPTGATVLPDWLSDSSGISVDAPTDIDIVGVSASGDRVVPISMPPGSVFCGIVGVASVPPRKAGMLCGMSSGPFGQTVVGDVDLGTGATFLYTDIVPHGSGRVAVSPSNSEAIVQVDRRDDAANTSTWSYELWDRVSGAQARPVTQQLVLTEDPIGPQFGIEYLP